MMNAGSRLLSLRAAICASPSRGVVMVERWYDVPLPREGKEPFLHPRRHRIYRMLEDTKHKKKEKMELILTQSVPKLGGRGDTVQVMKSLGRNRLLPQGLAVYASPENKQMFEEEKRQQMSLASSERMQSWTGERTVTFLQNSRLEVRIRQEAGWTLSAEMISRHFLRSLNVVVPLEALKIPDEPITTFGESWCEVTVNGVDTVRVPMDVVPFDQPRTKRYRIWLAIQAAKEKAAAAAIAVPPPEGSNAPQSSDG